MALTSDDDGGRRFDFSTNATVCAAVLGLALPNDELQHGATLSHLVFLPVAQHFLSFLPLY